MRDENGSMISRLQMGKAGTGPLGGSPCIDGVAEVTSRRSGVTSKTARPAEPQATFGRRRFEAGRDGRDAAIGEPTFKRIAEDAVSETLANDSAGSRVPQATRVAATRKRPALRRASLIACAFAFGVLLLPVFLVSFPETPIAATASNAGGFTVQLETVNARLDSHAGGRILEVAGRIANPSAAAAAVPPLRIDFSDESVGLRSRTLQTSVARLGAGLTVDFVSTIAVPDNAKGDVRVGFFGTDGKGNR